MANDYDHTLLKQIREYANELERVAKRKDGRDHIFKEMENLYFMKSYEEAELREKEKNLKLTRSPTARNAAKGMERLLIASDPQINIPHDINANINKTEAEQIENFCKAMWFASGRIAGDPIHYDVVRSALIYSMVIIAIKDVDMMVKNSSGGKKRRLEYIQQRTPYLFEVWNPKTTYFDSDITGVTAICRKIKTLAGHVESVYGEHVRKMVADATKKADWNRYTEVTLAEFYDEETHAVWIDGAEGAVLMEPVENQTIPVAAEIIEGSRLWEDERQVEPPLYTLWRSNLVDRENLTLSMMYTYVFNVGANPMFNEFLNDPTNAPEIDYTTPGFRARYYANERVEPMQKIAVDPSMLQGWEMARDLGTQSTIYPQVLGEPLGKNAPYSMVALLSQAGRLPLTVIQRKGSWVISEALEIALRWAREKKSTQQAAYNEFVVDLDTSIIPENINVQAILEISLPQDRLQAANAAAVLTQGERPLVSNRWVRENILNISGSKAMDTEIANELARSLFDRKFLLQQMAEIAQLEQAMMPGQAGGMPGAPQQAAPVMPQGMPPQGEPMQEQTPYGGRFPEGVQPMEPFPPYPGVGPVPPQME